MSSTTTAPNLINAIEGQIPPDTVRALASRLGEDRERTAVAVSTGIPSVLAALSDVVLSETGADYLKEIIDEKREHVGPPVEGSQVLLDATSGNDQGHEATLLDDELGQRAWSISDAVAQSSGIRRESAHRLLGGMASVAVNAVAESAGNLSAGGLRSFLNAQRRDWMNRLPRSIASAFETPPGALAVAPAPLGVDEPRVFAPPAMRRTWILPILLALALFLFVPLIRGARRSAELPASNARGAAPAVEPADEPRRVADLRAAPARADTPAARDDMVSALAMFLSAPATEATTPRRFTMPSLGFEAGGVEPSSAGGETINQVSAVLQAHPSAAVRIESFTDNVGRPEDNLELSRRRSEVVKALLVEDGADATRIEVGGLGQQRPVARNDTEEGRRQNQRTDLVVTQR